MMQILVLTSRNIYDNSGEYTLMSAKDKALKSEGIELIYYSFRRKFPQTKPENMNIVKQDSTFSLLFKKREVLENIISLVELYKLETILVSGGWVACMYEELLYLKEEFGLKLSYDYQGALEEIVEYRVVKNSKLLSLGFYKFLHYYEARILEIVDGVEAVSSNCLHHIKTTYKVVKDVKNVVIHCGIDGLISSDKYLEYREEYREKYNLAEDTIACVYAGGIAPWQNVDEVIKRCVQEKNVKLYIYTSAKNRETLKELYDLGDNVYFDYLPHEELEKALCAFDYGFLLRDEDITNYVAFPNKYSDYINARLTVIVKNKNIGYYPNDASREALIQNVEDSLDASRVKDESLYNQYIEELSYKNMIKRLVVYYQELGE